MLFKFPEFFFFSIHMDNWTFENDADKVAYKKK